MQFKYLFFIFFLIFSFNKTHAIISVAKVAVKTCKVNKSNKRLQKVRKAPDDRTVDKHRNYSKSGNGANVVKKVNKNSRSYKGETHVYAIRNPGGNVHKIGESATGTRLRDGASKRAEKQVRALNRKDGPGYTSEIRKTTPDKDSARTYETNLIKRYRNMYGQKTLPGNKTNR